MAAAANDPGERGGSRAARWLLAPPSLRRPTPGARPARRTSSVVAALPALAPRLVRLAHHGYSDRLLDGGRRRPAVSTSASSVTPRAFPAAGGAHPES